ncbi:MAG: SprB repeat-containing protein [Acidobacteria bacterium]|nr:SprB repeat-containing protein [Acidobacteriota bacterium]MCB9397195.1 SprB repeat-containing protein [Acidobacteriota bacterium]
MRLLWFLSLLGTGSIGMGWGCDGPVEDLGDRLRLHLTASVYMEIFRDNQAMVQVNCQPGFVGLDIDPNQPLTVGIYADSPSSTAFFETVFFPNCPGANIGPFPVNPLNSTSPVLFDLSPIELQFLVSETTNNGLSLFAIEPDACTLKPDYLKEFVVSANTSIQAQLTVQKTCLNGSSFLLNEPIVYDIRLMLTGTDPVDNLLVTDLFDTRLDVAGSLFAHSDIPDLMLNVSNGQLVGTATQLYPGEWHIYVQINAKQAGTIPNDAIVSADNVQIDDSQNSVSVNVGSQTTSPCLEFGVNGPNNVFYCAGRTDAISLTAQVSGGIPPYRYLWFPPEFGFQSDTIEFFPQTSDFYVVTVIDSQNCLAQRKIYVTVGSLIDIVPHFGDAGESPYDFNGDQKVDTQDLVHVVNGCL